MFSLLLSYSFTTLPEWSVTSLPIRHNYYFIALVVVGLLPWIICKSKGGLGRVGSESSPGDHYHIDNLYNPNFTFILQDKSFTHCQKWKQKVFVVLDMFKINFYCFIGFLR